MHTVCKLLPSFQRSTLRGWCCCTFVIMQVLGCKLATRTGHTTWPTHLPFIDALYGFLQLLQAMTDDNVGLIIRLLKQGRIFAINIGENEFVTKDAWEAIADAILYTNLGFMFIEVLIHFGCPPGRRDFASFRAFACRRKSIRLRITVRMLH